MAEFLLQLIRRRKALEYLGERENVVVSPFASKDECSAVSGGGVLVVCSTTCTLSVLKWVGFCAEPLRLSRPTTVIATLVQRVPRA